MKIQKTKNTKKWLLAWQRTGAVLEEMNLAELRAPDYYEKNVKFLNEMLKYAFANNSVRLSSGLVEMQKFFRKYRQK